MDSPNPIFLVGAVRSGSTLLRLMLDAHPRIINPGECDFMFDMVGDGGQFPDVSAYRRWLSTNRIFQAKHLKINPNLSYCDLIQSFIRQFARVDTILTMNVHRNFNRIPYIFPNARYIHLLRDPRDVARSCIGMGWAGHVYHAVDIWQSAERSWDQLKPSLNSWQYMEVRYEDVLEDVESGLLKICEFLGQEYSTHMMDYAESSSYSLPDKSLRYQWERKYSKRELQLVEGKIARMMLARKYLLSGHRPVKPGLFEALMLVAKNKNYRVRHQINRYGIRLYVENILASRLGVRPWMDICQKRKNQIDIRFLK